MKFDIHFLGLPWEIFFGVTTDDLLHLKPLKNVKKNAIFFKLFWYKVFVHWKSKLLNFLIDSVLKRKPPIVLMCATTLVNAEIDEKLIRERTVRHSNTLFQDEKANREQMVQRESIGKFSYFNFQWTKALYQNNLNN